MTTIDDLAHHVRTRRRVLGLTQEQLADLAGTSARFVWAMEQAKPSVRVDKLVEVLAVLGSELRAVPRSRP